VLAAALLLVPVAVVAQAEPRHAGYDVVGLPSLGPEPNIAVSPSGRMVIAGGGGESPSTFFLSADGGRTFRQLHPKFLVSGGADFDMLWLDDRRLVAADLSITAQGILIHRSSDAGRTWQTTLLDNDVYDRPWLARHGETVYVATRGLVDYVPYLFVSSDGGASFGPPEVIQDAVDDTDDPSATVPAIVQHLAVAPDGTAYVLVQRPAGLRLFRREPGAIATWVMTDIGQVYAENGFNWLTVDRAGAVYVLTHEVRAGVAGSWLYASTDRGATWSAGTNVAPGRGGSAMGSVAAGASGELAVVYLRGEQNRSGDQQRWWVEMAHVRRATSNKPVVTVERPVAQAIHTGALCMNLTCPPSERVLYDYVSVAMTAAGRTLAVVASTSEDIAGTKKGSSLTGIVLRSRL
jgi:hypothetical protein